MLQMQSDVYGGSSQVFSTGRSRRRVRRRYRHWLDADALTNPHTGKLKLLLDAIAREVGTRQRKIIAAAFALRFGGAGAAALEAFLVSRCVPDVRLSNITVKFSDSSLVERVALREHSCLEIVSDVASLRAVLCDQAGPVVQALSAWSKLKQSVLWGLVVAAWGDQLLALGRMLGCSERALQTIRELMSTNHPAFQLPPRYFVAADGGEAQVCQVRGSCCLNYRVPGNGYCVSCPLRSRSDASCSLSY